MILLDKLRLIIKTENKHFEKTTKRLFLDRKYVTTLREYHLISMRIQNFKSVRWIENFLQPVEFSSPLLKQNHGKKRASRAY